jgi:hypothetical protein
VVPESDWLRSNRPQVVKDSIRQAHDVLGRRNIDINSWYNGFEAGPRHLGSHTNDFFKTVGPRLEAAEIAGGRFGVLDELNNIKLDLGGHRR